MMNIAIIPARGGSKRIPRKNILEFHGKPMIAHAINIARQSGLFEHIVVSTDDDEIASIASKWGAVIPFVRPGNLSDDFTPTAPVMTHAIKTCAELGWDIGYACCIYPCVPFVRDNDIKMAFDLLQATQDADYCFPVTEFSSNIYRALRRLADGRMQPIYPEFELTRTQELEPAYHDAGQFYWGSAKAWLTKNRIHNNGVGLPIPNWRVVDIDTTEDWKKAELFYKLLEMEN